MTSSKTQLPFEYYSLNFCKPPKVEYQERFHIPFSYWPGKPWIWLADMKILKSENLGEVLRGDRIVNTLYNVNVSIGAHKLGEWYGQYHMVHMIWLNLYFEHVASIISDERTFKLLGSMWTDNERSKSRLIQRYVTPVNFPIHQKLINLPLNHSILLQLTPFNPKLNQFSPNSVEIYLKLTKFHP